MTASSQPQRRGSPSSTAYSLPLVLTCSAEVWNNKTDRQKLDRHIERTDRLKRHVKGMPVMLLYMILPLPLPPLPLPALPVPPPPLLLRFLLLFLLFLFLFLFLLFLFFFFFFFFFFRRTSETTQVLPQVFNKPICPSIVTSFAVASPRFIGFRSAFTVLGQDCLGRPIPRLHYWQVSWNYCHCDCLYTELWNYVGWHNFASSFAVLLSTLSEQSIKSVQSILSIKFKKVWKSLNYLNKN